MSNVQHPDSRREVADFVCTQCGCVCDDLKIEVDGDRLRWHASKCDLATSWLQRLQQSQADAVTCNGQQVDYNTALETAVKLISESRAPLIYGLSRSSSAGQRLATRLADRIGATIDTTASTCHSPSIMAIQQVGESTCSLGEAKNRCDLVLFWGCDPATTHPRHGERYSIEPTGLFLPHGRRDRHVIVIDREWSKTCELADEFYSVTADYDFETIWALRALLRDQPIELPPEMLPMARLQDLAAKLKNCRSGIVFFGLGLAQSPAGHAKVEALLRLVADLNAHTRFYARRMRIHGDVAGADTVLCWQTGFPFAVNLARGYPRYSPGEYSANELLSRHEVDLCLMIGSEGATQLSTSAQVWLRRIPTIVLDHAYERPGWQPTVSITTGVYGVHYAGTAYRMDEIPIPLRSVLNTHYPADHDVLRDLYDRVSGVQLSAGTR